MGTSSDNSVPLKKKKETGGVAWGRTYRAAEVFGGRGVERRAY